jgi:hypothetical protein
MNRADMLRTQQTIDREIAFILRDSKQKQEKARKDIRKFNNPLRALWWVLTGR